MDDFSTRYRLAMQEALADGTEPSPEHPKGPGEVTPEEFAAYPAFYLYDPAGRHAARNSFCGHGEYRITDSCPVCP